MPAGLASVLLHGCMAMSDNPIPQLHKAGADRPFNLMPVNSRSPKGIPATTAAPPVALARNSRKFSANVSPADAVST